MSNELATQTLTPQQRGWLNMATAKNTLVEELVKQSLTCQKILMQQPATITEKEQQLKDYKFSVNRLSEIRLESDFYKRLTMVEASLIKFEKDAAYKSTASTPANPDYVRLENELLELKQREQRKTQDTNEKNAEVARYKAHIQNQIELIVSDFKQRAWNEIKAVYEIAVKTGDADLFTPLAETINSMQFAIPATFQRTRITDEEAKPIKALFPVPKVEELRSLMITEARNIFANLESDIAANIKPDLQEKIQEIATETKHNVLINELTASVSVPELAPEGKGLKEAIEIEVEESQRWDIAIITAWLRHPEAAQYLKVKKWSALTTGQRAIALGKLATERGGMAIPGLTLRKVTSL